MTAGEPGRLLNSVPDDAVHFVLGALVTHIEERGSADSSDLAIAVEHWHRFTAAEMPADSDDDCDGEGCDEVHP